MSPDASACLVSFRRIQRPAVTRDAHGHSGLL